MRTNGKEYAAMNLRTIVENIYAYSTYSSSEVDSCELQERVEKAQREVRKLADWIEYGSDKVNALIYDENGKLTGQDCDCALSCDMDVYPYVVGEEICIGDEDDPSWVVTKVFRTENVQTVYVRKIK